MGGAEKNADSIKDLLLESDKKNYLISGTSI